MRYRRNINCLRTDELHDLREALAGMYALPASNPNSFTKIAGFHGGTPTSYCRHGAPGFFTWHRAYMMAFENALRSIRCNVTAPFWDWSSGPTTGVPRGRQMKGTRSCTNTCWPNKALNADAQKRAPVGLLIGFKKLEKLGTHPYLLLV